MEKIPSNIGGVTIIFGHTVNRNVSSDLVDAMVVAIALDVVPGHVITNLFISSASDSHICPSRHASGNGVDISRVNGKKIGTHYGSDSAIKKIVDGLQMRFENAPKRRENFGPTIQRKLGADYPVTGHKDHFHWSVNGNHSVCSSLINRLMNFLRLNAIFSNRKKDEICNI